MVSSFFREFTFRFMRGTNVGILLAKNFACSVKFFLSYYFYYILYIIDLVLLHMCLILIECFCRSFMFRVCSFLNLQLFHVNLAFSKRLVKSPDRVRSVFHFFDAVLKSPWFSIALKILCIILVLKILLIIACYFGFVETDSLIINFFDFLNWVIIRFYKVFRGGLFPVAYANHTDKKSLNNSFGDYIPGWWKKVYNWVYSIFSSNISGAEWNNNPVSTQKPQKTISSDLLGTIKGLNVEINKKYTQWEDKRRLDLNDFIKDIHDGSSLREVHEMFVVALNKSYEKLENKLVEEYMNRYKKLFVGSTVDLATINKVVTFIVQRHMEGLNMRRHAFIFTSAFSILESNRVRDYKDDLKTFVDKFVFQLNHNTISGKELFEPVFRSVFSDDVLLYIYKFNGYLYHPDFENMLVHRIHSVCSKMATGLRPFFSKYRNVYIEGLRNFELEQAKLMQAGARRVELEQSKSIWSKIWGWFTGIFSSTSFDSNQQKTSDNSSKITINQPKSTNHIILSNESARRLVGFPDIKGMDKRYKNQRKITNG